MLRGFTPLNHDVLSYYCEPSEARTIDEQNKSRYSNDKCALSAFMS